MVLSKPLIASIAAGAVLVSAFYLNYRHKKAAESYWNSDFIEAGEVSQLFVYPVKSCKPLVVSF